MSDDLVKQLGEIADYAETDTSKAIWDYPEAFREAAARIEALEARAEEAEAERDVLRDREKHFASVLSVADGGQYRNDWDAAIRRVVAERDALREALVKADELAGAIENDVWQNTQTWFALTAYREARDALKRDLAKKGEK